MRCWKEKDWGEHEERDTKEFLEFEKEIRLEMFPHNEQLFDDDDEDDEEKCVEVAETSNKRKRYCIEEGGLMIIVMMMTLVTEIVGFNSM